MEPEKLSFKLDVFEGPLDLLLHLIAKNKVDIYDIPIEEITGQYFAYLKAAEEFDLELGSEFLVMASQLLYIKSKMLLPKEEKISDEEDPRTQLVAKLLDYQAYRQLADYLRERENDGDVFFYHKREPFDFSKMDYEKQSFDLNDLTTAFREVLARKKEAAKAATVTNLEAIAAHKSYSIPEKIYEIREKLEEKGYLMFRPLLDSYETRRECIAVFLAILEMIKTSLAQIEFVPEEKDYRLKDGVEYEGNISDN